MIPNVIYKWMMRKRIFRGMLCLPPQISSYAHETQRSMGEFEWTRPEQAIVQLGVLQTTQQTLHLNIKCTHGIRLEVFVNTHE